MRQLKFRTYLQGIGFKYFNINENVTVSIKNGVNQFTGLTDKLGVEIFEGDIVKDIRGNIGQIIWDNDYCKYICFDDEFSWVYADVIEVIGNIHENPEMIK